MEIITSRQNPLVVALAKLSDKKYRDSAGLFLFEGRKLFSEAAASEVGLTEIICTPEYYEKYGGELAGRKVSVVSEGVYAKISQEKSPQGIICAALHLDKLHKSITIYKEDKNKPRERIFIAAGIQDPGNLGTIIRTAAAFGTDRLLLDNSCADLYNYKTVRASMGALFRLPVTVCADMAGTVASLRESGRRVFAAALDRTAIGIDKLDLCVSDCFAVGNEGHGLDAEVIAGCDGSVFIPMEPEAESLNASQAATIILWEQYKNFNKT